MCCLILLNLD